MKLALEIERELAALAIVAAARASILNELEELITTVYRGVNIYETRQNHVSGIICDLQESTRIILNMFGSNIAY